MPAKKKAEEIKEEVKAAEAKAGKAVKETAARAKSAAKKTARKAEDKVTADKIEVRKTAAKAVRGVKTAAKKVETAAKKTAAKAKAVKTEIVIQSPMGGDITPEEIAKKVPAGTECVFVRIDQNKLWWVKGEETGSVNIWD